MMIYQVEADVGEMDREQLDQELRVVDEMLALAGGRLFCAEPTACPGLLNLYLCIKGRQAVTDILEASDFSVRQIRLVGRPRETYISFGAWGEFTAPGRKRRKTYLVEYEPYRQLVLRGACGLAAPGAWLFA